MNYSIWITCSCNMKCDYCYEKDLGERSMTMSTAQKVLRFMERQNDKDDIHLHGGEVFTNLDVLDYLTLELKKCGRRMNLTTNGTLLNNKKAIKILNRLDSIQISLDGDKNTYEQSRHFKVKRDCFDNIIENAQRLLREGKNVVARMTLTPQNIDELITGILYLVNIGFKKIMYSIDYFSDKWNKNRIDMLTRQLVTVSDMRGSLLQRGIWIEGEGENIPHPLGVCTGGITRLDIYVDGYIYPCTFTVGNAQFCIGNVEMGVEKDWKYKLLEITKHSMSKGCEKCAKKTECRMYKCRFMNKSITNSLFSVSQTSCEIQKALLKKQGCTS